MSFDAIAALDVVFALLRHYNEDEAANTLSFCRDHIDSIKQMLSVSSRELAYHLELVANVEQELSALEESGKIAHDKRLARSMVDAQMTDIALVSQLAFVEEQERQDRAYALGLSRAENSDDEAEVVSAPPRQQTSSAETSVALAKLAGKYLGEKAGLTLHPEFGFESVESEPGTPLELPQDCFICASQVSWFELVRLPCGHDYCQECLNTLLETAFKDEAFFPPRCCRVPVGIEGIKMFLSRDMVDEHELKSIEHATQDRTYCASTDCCKFIKPDDIDGSEACCEHCGAWTCSLCKKDYHSGDCEEDNDLETTLAVAREQGWRQCPCCRTMIELTYGCNHMSCRCGGSFCYVCLSSPWKSCRCPQWDEDLLLEQTARVAAQPGNRRDAEQIRQDLIENHECEHTDWHFSRGAGDCEACGDSMPVFTMQCSACYIDYCRRCRDNRLR